MQDLVAVGVADAGDERLVAQQVLELARMAPDPLAPDLERQSRDRRRRGPGRGRPDRGPAGRRRPAAGRSCPSASGRGSGSRAGVVGRQPGRAARPRRGVGGPARARTEAEDDGGLGRRLVARRGQLEPAGQHRVADDRVALEIDQQELAAPPDRRDRWPTRASSSAGVPRTASGPGAFADRIGPPGEGRVEGVGDHGQIGQFGHGRAIVVVGKRVLDSPGPERQDS